MAASSGDAMTYISAEHMDATYRAVGANDEIDLSVHEQACCWEILHTTVVCLHEARVSHP